MTSAPAVRDPMDLKQIPVHAPQADVQYGVPQLYTKVYPRSFRDLDGDGTLGLPGVLPELSQPPAFPFQMLLSDECKWLYLS